jgi:hypothetical protein
VELRLLTTDAERRIFIDRMTHARAVKNGGFRETERSCVGRIHMEFGRMYALFDDAGPHPDQMIAGFIMHDLASFAQSYPKPDFSCYSPQYVFEFGELWSLARGAGTILQRAGVLLLGLLQAQAVVGYAIVKPWDLTMFYRDLVPVGEPIEWPYARTLDGGKIYCRAMVSEGDHLRAWVNKVWATGFETHDNHRRLRFPDYIGEVPQSEELIVAPTRQEETNGAAHA